ncbi:hypothetical protein, partial [Enterobacter hormaechei]|uniref:hypothetical protein n=1 Tax=Enterobacter hormaechei TaxID=158836 RepID=UPI001F0AD869
NLGGAAHEIGVKQVAHYLWNRFASSHKVRFVAMLMRRGCRVHFCFFNLGGAAHEIGVKQVAHYLWNRFASSHKVRFVA